MAEQRNRMTALGVLTLSVHFTQSILWTKQSRSRSLCSRWATLTAMPPLRTDQVKRTAMAATSQVITTAELLLPLRTTMTRGSTGTIRQLFPRAASSGRDATSVPHQAQLTPTTTFSSRNTPKIQTRLNFPGWARSTSPKRPLTEHVPKAPQKTQTGFWATLLLLLLTTR